MNAAPCAMLWATWEYTHTHAHRQETISQMHQSCTSTYRKISPLQKKKNLVQARRYINITDAHKYTSGLHLSTHRETHHKLAKKAESRKEERLRRESTVEREPARESYERIRAESCRRKDRRREGWGGKVNRVMGWGDGREKGKRGGAQGKAEGQRHLEKWAEINEKNGRINSKNLPI